MIVEKVDDNIRIQAEFYERDKVRQCIRGLYWDPALRCWSVPATISTFKNLKEYAPALMHPNRLTPVIREWYNELLAKAERLDELQKGTGELPRFNPDFKFPIPMFRHQQDAVAFGLNIPKAAIWLDLGLGKTYVSITIARYRHEIFKQVNKVLVVTPLSTTRQWRAQIEQYGMGAKAILIDGTPQKKRQWLDAVARANALTFGIVTYESLGALSDSVDDVAFDMFILDESTKIKNPKALRTKATVNLCQGIPYGVELTGLAYLNNPTDLYSQFLALDTTVYGVNQYAFEDQYINWLKRPFGRIMGGIKNLDELKKRAYFIAFSRSKKNCLDLPEKVVPPPLLVPLYDTQAAWYDQVRKEAIGAAKVGGDQLDIKGVLAQMEKLQQITSGFIMTDDNRTIWLDSPKYQEAIDIIQNSTENFIVWVKHRAVCSHMLSKLEAAHISHAELSRWVSDIRRDDAIKAFKKGLIRVLVCSIQSECRGLDLTSTKPVNSIYLENTFSIDERWQSESRQHRIGMSGSATYIDIVTEDTVDETVLEVLRQKKNISEYIAEIGLEIALGAGGSISTRKSRSQKKIPKPEDMIEEELPKIHGL